ncbi:Uncharacterised protein [Mycobacteroides abscessus subsp. massiliense]|nr:Uncharacterised protein [Mycobacteroides abscessus subsp. massiliense]
MGLHPLAELANAVHPQRNVARPIAVIEGAAGRLDGTTHVVTVGIRRGSEHLLGGRVHRRESPRTSGEQLSVDEQFTVAIGQNGHISSSPNLDTCPFRTPEP